MMPQLIRAEYLLCDPDLSAAGVIHDGALVIDGGEIIAAGPWSELQSQYSHLTSIGGPDDWLVIPGLVNAHHHGRGISTLAAGMLDAPLELWVPSFILYPGFDPYWNTLYAATNMLRSGITTSLQSHSSAGPLSTFRHSVEAALVAYQDARVRVAFAMGLFDQQYLAYIPDREFIAGVPRALQDEVRRGFDLSNLYIDLDDYFSLFEELYLQCGSKYPRAKLMLSPIGLQWASDELLQRMAAMARAYETGLHIHLVETIYQRTYALRRFGASAVETLERFGLLNPRVSLAHGIWTTKADLDRLAASGATIVTNASSNLRLGSGLLPLIALREHGINVAIGIDNNSLSDDEDMFREMRLVTVLHRPPGLDSNWASPYDVLRMATVGGARAALLDGQIGRLLPGYRADVTVVNLNRIRRPYVHPRVDVVALALARAQAADVDTVLVDGEVLLRGGKFTRLDRSEIEDKLAKSGRVQEGDQRQDPQLVLTQLQPYLRAVYDGWEPEEYQPYYRLNSRV